MSPEPRRGLPRKSILRIVIVCIVVLLISWLIFANADSSPTSASLGCAQNVLMCLR